MRAVAEEEPTRVPTTEVVAWCLSVGEGNALFLRGGDAPAVGSVFTNPALARTYERLGRKGPRYFYRGKLAACRFFFAFELPKVAPMLDLLASLDDTTLTMQDAWF